MVKVLILALIFSVGIILTFNVPIRKEEKTMKKDHKKICLSIVSSILEFALNVNAGIVATLLLA